LIGYNIDYLKECVTFSLYVETFLSYLCKDTEIEDKFGQCDKKTVCDFIHVSLLQGIRIFRQKSLSFKDI